MMMWPGKTKKKKDLAFVSGRRKIPIELSQMYEEICVYGEIIECFFAILYQQIEKGD
jgi:hypothetical protein